MDDNAAVTQKQLTAVKDEILSAIRQMIAESKSELRSEFRGDLKSGLNDLRDELTEQMRQIETNMLTGFHSYGRGISHRMHDLEGSDVDIKGRLAALEDRILNLETRRH